MPGPKLVKQANVKQPVIEQIHLLRSLANTRPSVSPSDRARLRRMQVPSTCISFGKSVTDFYLDIARLFPIEMAVSRIAILDVAQGRGFH
jgi:hypothetical protein